MHQVCFYYTELCLSVDLLGCCRFHQVGEGEVFFILQLLYEVTSRTKEYLLDGG